MEPRPIVVDEHAREWEGWADEHAGERGDVVWKTLISGGVTESSDLTAGIARVPSGEALHEHHHAQAEIYFVLEGHGVVTIGGADADVAPGQTVFIAPGALHGLRSTGPGDLRIFYVLAADAFEDVTYVFPPAGQRRPTTT